MGVVLYIMLSGKVPFPGRDEREIIQNVIKGEFHFNHQAFKTVSEECKDLIKKCLIKDISKRITAVQASQHPWILSKSAEGLQTGTIGGGVNETVIQGIDEIIRYKKMKDATLNHLTNVVQIHGIKTLQEQFE